MTLVAVLAVITTVTVLAVSSDDELQGEVVRRLDDRGLSWAATAIELAGTPTAVLGRIASEARDSKMLPSGLSEDSALVGSQPPTAVEVRGAAIRDMDRPSTESRESSTTEPGTDGDSNRGSRVEIPIDQDVGPHLRHLELKRYMLELINEERESAGLNPVGLGDNRAAQLHAESSFENCFASHWGLDGLKPYMRYSLAGGFQSNGENGHGTSYCITESDGYRQNRDIQTEVRDAMAGWMDSSGHRRNILDPTHKQVNIGLAWDRFNFVAIQHFEGDYVRYDTTPVIEDGVLKLKGTLRNGATAKALSGLGVQIYYDPPPQPLTRAQVARTYCYDGGRLIASLREPLQPGWFWDEHEFSLEYEPCPDPYAIAADALPPTSHDEAHQFWQDAYDASQSQSTASIVVPWLTADEWRVRPEVFYVKADLESLLQEHGAGVYTILVWATVDGEDSPVSQYSVFYELSPPGTYD